MSLRRVLLTTVIVLAMLGLLAWLGYSLLTRPQEMPFGPLAGLALLALIALIFRLRKSAAPASPLQQPRRTSRSQPAAPATERPPESGNGGQDTRLPADEDMPDWLADVLNQPASGPATPPASKAVEPEPLSPPAEPPAPPAVDPSTINWRDVVNRAEPEAATPAEAYPDAGGVEDWLSEDVALADDDWANLEETAGPEPAFAEAGPDVTDTVELSPEEIAQLDEASGMGPGPEPTGEELPPLADLEIPRMVDSADQADWAMAEPPEEATAGAEPPEEATAGAEPEAVEPAEEAPATTGEPEPVPPPPPMPPVPAAPEAVEPAAGEPAEGVQFAAYYPREVRPEDWQPLKAYIFKEFALAAVRADVAAQMGPRPDIRETVAAALQPIADDALVTAIPHIPGFEFDPPQASTRFRKDWKRFDFEFRAVEAPLDEGADGRITFLVEGVIVADVKLSVYVSRWAGRQTVGPQESTARPYQAIFCSYSHRDSAIVEKVERFSRFLFTRYLRDVTSLRSGERWNDRLLEMIDEADIFQLFWSAPAAQSPYVRQEWQYALALRNTGAKDRYFIRPVRWEEPMPAPPPPELADLQFEHIKELAEE